MTANRTTELLPCPFCGGEAETYNPFDGIDGLWSVLCSECASCSGFEQTEAEAIAAWNTRAGCGECENVAPSYLDFLCSSCGFVHYHSDENDSGDGNEWNFCPSCGKAVKR